MPLDLPKCDICEQNDVQITCIKCDMNFCKACDEKQHSKGRPKEHKRDIYSGLDIPSRFCTMKSHEQQLLSLFCQTCSTPICGICVVEGHKGHTYVRAEVAAENAKGVLKATIVPLQNAINKSEAEIKATQEKIKFLQGEIKKQQEILQGEVKKQQDKIKETKKNIDKNLQKIEEINSVLRKQVDSFAFLSMFYLKVPKVKVLLTDEGVRLSIPALSVANRLMEVAAEKKLKIEYVQNYPDVTILVQGYTSQPQENELKRKLAKLPGEAKIVLYLQISKDITKVAAPFSQLTSETGLYLFHFIGTSEGLHPISNYEQEQEEALITLLSKFAQKQ